MAVSALHNPTLWVDAFPSSRDRELEASGDSDESSIKTVYSQQAGKKHPAVEPVSTWLGLQTRRSTAPLAPRFWVSSVLWGCHFVFQAR